MAKSARRRAIEEVRAPTRAEICAHEAGHAIVQLASGPGPWIKFVEVNHPDEERLGVVWTEAMWQPWMREEVTTPDLSEQRRDMAARDVVNYLAGNIAEFRFRGRSRTEIQFGSFEMADACLAEPAGSRTDYGMSRNRLEWIAPGAERNAFMHAWLAAETIAASWWKEILKLAHELELHGRIEDAQPYAMWNGMREARGERAIRRARRAAGWLANLIDGGA